MMHITPTDLEAFALGRLEDAACAEIEAHLAECEACARRFDEVDLTGDGLVGWLRGEKSPMPVERLSRGFSGADSALPARLGRFEICDQLGEGGMGTVYRAFDPRLQRHVALKIIHARHVAGAEARRRFRQEAKAEARLQHANIVSIFEFGEHEGIAYCVFEFVEGGDLARRISASPLDSAAAVDLMITLADAVHYAHQQQVIHRDLKPENILLTASDVPKIADFGLAKLLDETQSDALDRTLDGTLVGTPTYMAPEQAAADIKSIGPATDVYALGCVLYKLVTGRPPFQGSSVSDILAQVRHRDPVSPRRLAPGLDRDLETICLKCLRKSPAERYPSAADLAASLRAHRAGLPIPDRRLGVWEHTVKFVKRHPVEAGAAAVLALTLLAFFATIVGYNVRLRTLLADNQRGWELERRNSYSLRLQQVATTALTDPTRALRLLDDPQRCPPELRDFTWHYLWQTSQRQHKQWQNGADVLVLAASAHSGWFAAGDRQGVVRFWAVDQPGPLCEISAHAGAITDLRFAPAGNCLAASSDDGTVSFWNIDGQRTQPALAPDQGPINSIAWSPDGARIAVAHTDGMVRIWRFPELTAIKELEGHQASVFRTTFNGDGRYLATCSRDQTLRIWRTTDWSQITAPRMHRGFVTDVRFHPQDALQLATSCNDRTVRQWRIDASESAELTHKLRGFDQTVSAIAYSLDGTVLAAGSYDGLVRAWNSSTGQLIVSRSSAPAGVSSVSFDAAGYLLAGTTSGTIERWTLDVEQPQRFRAHEGPLLGLVFLGSSREILSGGFDGGLVVWRSTEEGWEPGWRHSQAWMADMAYSPGRRMFVWDGGGTILAGRLATNGKILRREIPSPAVSLNALAVSGQQLLLADLVGIHSVCLATGAVDWSWTEAIVLRLTVSPALDLIAAAGEGDRVWTGSSTLGQFSPFSTPAQSVSSLTFSPEGRTLAVGGANGVIALHQAAVGKLDVSFAGHSGAVYCLAFSPDGKTLASGGSDGEIRLWDTVAGVERGNFTVGNAVQTLTFSPDSFMLACGTDDGHIWIWSARQRANQGAFFGR